LVRKTELAAIEQIVDKAWRDHFGSHPVEIRLEPGTDFLYGDDLVEIYVIFETLPTRLGGPDWENFRGRKSLDFKEQIDDMMVEQELFVDTVFRYGLHEDFEPAVAED